MVPKVVSREYRDVDTATGYILSQMESGGNVGKWNT